jgi:hypothetical protein
MLSANKPKLIPESFNNELIDAINAISYDTKNVKYAGSFVRKSNRDASDIDLSEDFKNDTDKTISKRIQLIIKKLLKTNYIILDIKSGIDPIFIDKFNNLGTIKKHKVINYNYDATIQEIKELHQYIDKQDYDDLLKLVKENPSLLQYFEMREKIRKIITLRWSPEEIIKGYKVIRNEKFYLYQSLPLFITKIDIAFIFNGFYTEMSNVFIIKSATKYGLTFLPLSPKPDDYDSCIKYNLEEYMTYSKYLKAIKRLYSMANHNNNNKLMVKLNKVLLSDIGILNKANNIIKTIINIIELGKNIDIKEINIQLDNLKPLLSNIYEFSFNEKKLDFDIDKIIKKFNLKQLEDITIKLDNKINTYTHKLIKEYNIKIPSNYYL